MSHDIIGKIVEAVVRLPAETLCVVLDLVQKIGSKDEEEYLKNLKRFLKKEPIVWMVEKILRPLGTVEIPAVPKFNARTAFTTGKWYLGSNFEKNFLADKEVDVTAVTLRPHELLKGSRDEGIRKELGPDKEEIQLGQFHAFLMTAADHSKWYVAYIKDSKGNLWAVGARWFGDGWRVCAVSVERPGGWGAGCVVVSR